MPRLFDYIVGFYPDARKYVWCICDSVLQQAMEYTHNFIVDYGLPNAIPPFENTFLEFRGPDNNILGVFVDRKIYKDEIHVKMRSWKLVDREFWCAYAEVLFHLAAKTGNFSMNTRFPFVVRHLDERKDDLFTGLHLDGNHEYSYSVDVGDTPEIRYLVASGFWCLTTLSLMNAKNVELIDNPPPKKANQRHIEKHGVPMLSYKVLKVSPATLKHYTQDIEEQAKSGEKREIPLHLVRGHFKDYRDGKGLFGRVKDVIWFQEQWRGKPENGIALKDYELHPPKAEHQE